MGKQYRISIRLNDQESTMLDELKTHYSTSNVNNILRVAIMELYKNRQPMEEFVLGTTGASPQEKIFEDILGLSKYAGGKKTNLYVGSGKQADAILFVKREMSSGESLSIKISASRMKILHQMAESEKKARVMIVYKKSEEQEFHLLLFDMEEMVSPLFKTNADGSVFFYINKVTTEYFEKTRDKLGANFQKIYEVLNESTEC